MTKYLRMLCTFTLALLVLAGCAQFTPRADTPDILRPQACSPVVTMDETIQLLKENGRMPQSEWATAGAVAKAESGLCVSAQGPTNDNGTVDYGLYQVNSTHGYSLECLYAAACNTDAAMYVYELQGWGAWTVYNTGDYQAYLSEAEAAMERVAAGDGGTTVTGTTANTGEYTGPYNLRSGPGTSYDVVGSVNGGETVSIVCQTRGTSHTGPWGETSLWDKLSTGEWISDAFVYTGSNDAVAPTCD